MNYELDDEARTIRNEPPTKRDPTRWLAIPPYPKAVRAVTVSGRRPVAPRIRRTDDVPTVQNEPRATVAPIERVVPLPRGPSLSRYAIHDMPPVQVQPYVPRQRSRVSSLALAVLLGGLVGCLLAVASTHIQRDPDEVWEVIDG